MTPSTSACHSTPLPSSLLVLQAFTHTHTHEKYSCCATEPDLMAHVKPGSPPCVMLPVTDGNYSPFSELRDHDLRFSKLITACFYLPLPISKPRFPLGERDISRSWFSTPRKHSDFLYSRVVRVRDQWGNCTHKRFTVAIHITIMHLLLLLLWILLQ